MTARPADLLRIRLAVSFAQLLCGVGGVFGSGARGVSVRDFAGGAFRSDTTLVAPAQVAFSLWGLIYLGLAVYTLCVWAPGTAIADFVRRTGWWAAAAMALNGVWIFAAMADQLVAGVVILAGLTVCLGRVCQALIACPLRSLTARVLVEGVFGTFLGWSTIATVGNVATALVRHGVPPTGPAATISTVITLAAVAGLGVYYAYRLPAQFGVAFGLLWGLAFLAVQRSAGEPHSLPVAYASAAAAAVIAGAFADTAPLRVGRRRQMASLPDGRPA